VPVDQRRIAQQLDDPVCARGEGCTYSDPRPEQRRFLHARSAWPGARGRARKALRPLRFWMVHPNAPDCHTGCLATARTMKQTGSTHHPAIADWIRCGPRMSTKTGDSPGRESLESRPRSHRTAGPKQGGLLTKVPGYGPNPSFRALQPVGMQERRLVLRAPTPAAALAHGFGMPILVP